MDQFLLQQAIKLNKARRRRRYLRRAVGMLGIVVTFVTTYLLILPAITMEKEAVCGLDAHAHTDACYSPVEMYLACDPEAEGAQIVHSHGALCYDSDGALQCSLSELREHTHVPECYSHVSELVCPMEESQAHAHDINCYTKELLLTCTQEEQPQHTHGETCYRSYRELACGLPECEPHTHTEQCYINESIQICDQVECQPHSHDESCYELRETVICTLTEADGHTHDDTCYGQEKILRCTQEETTGHTHGENCFQKQSRLACTVELPEGHSHTENCYRESVQLDCGMEESEGHSHQPECFAEQDVLSCELEETDSHIHGESCYVIHETVTCPLPEVILHSHTDECYEEDENEKWLVCEQPLVVEHTHEEQCLASMKQMLICESTEHIHSSACYEQEETSSEPEGTPAETTEVPTEATEAPSEPAETVTETTGVTDPTEIPTETTEAPTETTEAPSEPVEGVIPPSEGSFRCGFGMHQHGESCYDAAGTLNCTVPEHTHNAGCVMSDYDPNADVETREMWEATLSGVSLTGSYRQDVLAIAKSQLGYTESLQNRYLMDDGTLNGYTRYGDWYGYSYGDWCAMFVSFCLNYADVSMYPLDCVCEDWIGQLQEANFYRDAQTHTPQPGELVFFDWERGSGGSGRADHVGLVTEVTGERITTIEGNSGDAVRYRTYASDDPSIIGYGLMPEGKTVRMESLGEDYAVSVCYDASAGIPPDAELVVAEIPQDSEEYRIYLEQAAAAMQAASGDETAPDISFARFFDISFVVNGQIIEPTAPVEVSIRYNEAVQMGQEEVGKAVHFATDGVEVLEAETSGSGANGDGGAYTFTYTQDSFSVSGTVVTNGGNARAASIDLSNAEELSKYITAISIINQNNEETTMFLDGDTFTITMDVNIYGWQYSGGQDKTLYITLAEQMKLTGLSYTGNAESGVLDVDGNAAVLVAPAVTDQWGNAQNVSLQVVLTGTAVNQTGGVASVSVHNVECTVYHSSQSFTHTADDGTVTELDLMGSSYSPSEYELVVEQEDASGFEDTIGSFVQSNYVRREAQGNAVFHVYLRSKTDPSAVVQITGPYSLTMKFAATPVQVHKAGSAILLNLTSGSAQRPASGAAEYSDGSVTMATISDTYGTLSRFSVTALSGLTAGISGSGYSLEYNTVTDAFIKDPAYRKYYNQNSPIGTAGSFHLVGFDTVTLSSHTNGNILAKNLYAGENFGTNNYSDELTYVQNYRKVHATSASNLNHVLVIGSSNTLELYDNNNRYSINSVGIDKPKNIIQDEDTDAAPFIDLNRVRAEIQQLSSVMAGFAPNNLLDSSESQRRVLTLTDPDSVGVITVNYPDSRVFGSTNLDLKGFQSGYSGSIVINVNCAGATKIKMPTALIYIDGQVQGTDEVTNFTSGKVVWNFINAQGVTIEAQRMTGMIIAPGATVNINQNLNGTVVADVINVLAESHRTDFTGEIIPRGTVDYSITLRKIRSGYVGTALSGAEFTLEIWNGSQWDSVETESIVTDADGLFLLRNLQKDTAYRLVETKAPVGYTPMEEPYCFWIQSAAGITAPSVQPDGFSGVALDTGATLNIPNEPDEQVNTTQIQLEKQWVGELPVLAERITVMVYQITQQEGQELGRTHYKTVTLTSALDWKLTLEDLPLEGTDAEGNAVTYAYSVEEASMEGYTVAYSENNEAGAQDGVILITNTELSYGYVLPETGGTGTGYLACSGIFLLVFAGGCIFIIARKKREADA